MVSLCVDAVLNLILLFNSFLSPAEIWELRTKSFSASKLVLYLHLNGPTHTFISLLIVTTFTKSPGIVKNILLLTLTPRPWVLKFFYMQKDFLKQGLLVQPDEW